MRKMKTFRLTTISAALALAFGSAWADSVTSEEVKELIRPDSSISAGVGIWGGDRHQLGIYDGMRKDKAYGFLDLDLVKRDEATGTWLTLMGRNLGQDTRELKGEWLRQGDIGVSLGYSRLTRDHPLTFITGLQGIGTSTQRLSGAAGVNNLPDQEVTIGTTRDLVELGFYKSFSKTIELTVNLKNEEKSGARHWGLGSAAYFLTEPIDSTTRQFEAILNYTGDQLQLSGGYNASWYQNANTVASGTENGGATTALSLPLGNQAHQMFVNGGYAFTPSTRGTFKVSYSKATQDEALPIANWTIAAGMPGSLSGRVDTRVVEFGLTSRPLPKLSLTANLRYNDVKDKTPVRRFTSLANGFYTPHSFTTKTGKLEGTYRLPDGYSLTAGVDRKDQSRSVPTMGDLAAVTNVVAPFRQSIDETTYRLQLRRALSDTVNGSLAYLQAKREGSGDVLTTAGGVMSAINPSHIANRKRDKWRGTVDWTPMAELSLQFAAEDSRDKYEFRPPLAVGALNNAEGLQSGSANLYSVDASYTLNDNWQATAYYSIDVTKSRQSGKGTVATAQKVTDLKETGDSLGLGLKGQLSAKLALGANLEWVKSVTAYRQSGAGVVAGAGMTTALPDITNKMTRIKFFTDYEMAKNSNLRFELVHERWQTDDWTWAFSNGSPFVYNGLTTNIDGTTVTAKAKQVSNFLGARYIYKFQ